MENWRDIRDYEGLYQVSSSGIIRRIKIKGNREIKLGLKFNGYLRVFLYKNSIQRTCIAHRLVAEAFLPNPHSLPCVHHKNGIKTDNRVENLEWISVADNLKLRKFCNLQFVIKHIKDIKKYHDITTIEELLGIMSLEVLN